jgi:hypothetical protein
MEAEDWLKGVQKKLVIAQCTDHKKVLFATHQLFDTTANWWETYCSTMQMLSPSLAMSSRLVFVITMYPVAP